MSVLDDPGYERMAQLLARGLSQGKAYIGSGIPRDPEKQLLGNADVRASILARKPWMKARVKELLNEAARAASITPVWIAERIKEIADRALAADDFGNALKALTVLGQMTQMLGTSETDDNDVRKTMGNELAKLEEERTIKAYLLSADDTRVLVRLPNGTSLSLSLPVGYQVPNVLPAQVSVAVKRDSVSGNYLTTAITQGWE